MTRRKPGPRQIKGNPTRPPVPVYDGEGSWPAEHTLSVLHGVYSQRIRDPIEERMAEVIRAAMTEGLGPAYNPALDEHAIRRAARALCTVEMVEARIAEHGYEHISDKLGEHYKTATNQAAKWLAELGMTPAARAKLGVDVAKQHDIVSALAERKERRDAAPVRAKAVRLCDYCEVEPARYRVKKARRVICLPCKNEGRHCA